MSRRANLRPLAPKAARSVFHVAIDSAQLVADVRAHFPELESWLAREYPDTPLDAFANQPPRALLFVLIRQAEQELHRREKFVASLIRPGPNPDDLDALERFAIQEEGTDQRVKIEIAQGSRAAQEDRLGQRSAVPPPPSSS